MFASLSATVHQARRHDDLYFAGLLKAQEIEAALGPARALFRGWLYTPAITVWTFLSQCLSPDHSCREAVARFIAWRVSRGQQACSAETGGGLSGPRSFAGGGVPAITVSDRAAA